MKKKATKLTAAAKHAVARRVLHLHSLETGTKEALSTFEKLDREINPFDLISPVKGNFPGGPLEAIEYYQARLDVCIRARDMLTRAAGLTQSVVESSEKAADAFEKLKPEDLDAMQVPDVMRPGVLREWAAKLSPMIAVFAGGAKSYAERGELIERGITALRAKVVQ